MKEKSAYSTRSSGYLRIDDLLGDSSDGGSGLDDADLGFPLLDGSHEPGDGNPRDEDSSDSDPNSSFQPTAVLDRIMGLDTFFWVVSLVVFSASDVSAHVHPIWIEGPSPFDKVQYISGPPTLARYHRVVGVKIPVATIYVKD